jgi:O-antigen/teichoic acid export membrane protein
MTPILRLRNSGYGSLMGNVAARVGGLACLFVATLILARSGGPAVVGIYALLHVLPGLVGTLASVGLAVAAPYFLAGPERDDRSLPLTLLAIAVGGGAAGTALWIASAQLFGSLLFPDLSLTLVMVAGLGVFTRLVTIMAKSCSQGSGDLYGANRVIFTEEFMFLPAYALLWSAGARGYAPVVVGLLLADAATASLGWARLVRKGFFRAAARPSLALARRVASYGLRAQVGGLIAQLNLRLDFVLLSLLAGPAVLGVYAIASKFAELIRLVTMAVTYVLYPRFAREGWTRAAEAGRRLIGRAGLATAGAVVPLWIAAGFAVPVLYGSAFEPAVTPARIILLGLALEGVAAVITAFLLGVGRPGLNSSAMAVGLVATLALDLLLIPRYEAVGAAIASAVAYLTTTLVLVWFFRRAVRARRAAEAAGSALNGALARADAR